MQSLGFMSLGVAAVMAALSHYVRNTWPTLAAVEAGLAVLNLGLAIRGFILHALIITFQKKG